MRKWSKRSLDSLRGIHPDLRRVMDRALQESPLDFIVIEGLRTVERQRKLVAQGASKTMNSRHITGHAVDLMPVGPDGKGSFDWGLYHQLAPAVKKAAKSEGVAIVWGGDWKSFRDGPHFELDRKVYPADGKHVLVTEAQNLKPPLPKPVADRPLDTKPVVSDIGQDVKHKPSLWAALGRLFAAIFRGRK